MVVNLLENIKIQRIIPINLNDTSISSWYVRNNPNTTEKVSEILGKNVENLVTVVLQSKRQLLHPLTKVRSYNWTVNRPPPPAGSAHTPRRQIILKNRPCQWKPRIETDLAADDLYDRAEKGNFERARSLSLAIVIVPPSARRRKEEKGSVDRSTAVNKHRVREEHAVKQYIAPLVASLTERNNVSVHERHRATVCRGAYTPRREAVGHRKNNTHNRLLNCVPRQWTKWKTPLRSSVSPPPLSFDSPLARFLRFLWIFIIFVCWDFFFFEIDHLLFVFDVRKFKEGPHFQSGDYSFYFVKNWCK